MNTCGNIKLCCPVAGPLECSDCLQTFVGSKAQWLLNDIDFKWTYNNWPTLDLSGASAITAPMVSVSGLYVEARQIITTNNVPAEWFFGDVAVVKQTSATPGFERWQTLRGYAGILNLLCRSDVPENKMLNLNTGPFAVGSLVMLRWSEIHETPTPAPLTDVFMWDGSTSGQGQQGYWINGDTPYTDCVTKVYDFNGFPAPNRDSRVTIL